MKNTVKILYVTKRISVIIMMSEKTVGEFLTAFGIAFALKDPMEGVSYTKRADDYSRTREDLWKVTVTVDSNQGKDLLSFIKKFCGDRKVVFNRGSQKL